MSDEVVGSVVGTVKESIGILTLNRPHLHNAISKEMWLALPTTLKDLRDGGAKVVIVTGNGATFSAGADLTELESIAKHEDAEAIWHPIRDSLNFLFSFELPTIAMVNGSCMGGGCLLAIACDFRYATREAKFAIPVAKLGILLDQANILRLTALVGAATAKELLFTGATISSERAVDVGLIDKVLEVRQLSDEVMGTARAILLNSQESVRESKKLVNHATAVLMSATDVAELTAQDQRIIDSYLSEDFQLRIKGR